MMEKLTKPTFFVEDFHQTPGQMSQGLDVEADDYQDDAGCSTSSSGGLKDENLRRQIHAVVQETIYSEDPAFQQLRDREDLTGSASLDHRLMPDIGASDEGEGGGVAGNLFDNLSARLKPGKRKGSLDDVIGKLTAGVFRPQSSVGSSESDEMGSSAFDSFEEYGSGHSQPKRIRLDDDSPDETPRQSSDYSQSMSVVEHRKDPPPTHHEMLSVTKNEYSGDGSMPSEGGQPIKLVIKKLKIPTETPTSLARAMLSSKLAKSSEMAKLSQQAAAYAAQQQSQQMKRMSPVNVEPAAKMGVAYIQKQPGEMTAADKKSSKFNDFKQRAEERKFKKAASANTAKPPGYAADQLPYGKMPSTDAAKMSKIQEKYALKSPKLDLERKSAEKVVPYVKVTTPMTPTDLTNTIPGTEGILFSKSLAGYKIPKVDDTAKGQIFPPAVAPVYSQQQSANPPEIMKNPGLQSPPRKPPFQPPPQTKVPKPILKHSHSTPPPPQTQLHYAVQQQKADSKRRPLLPDPPPRFPPSADRGISAPMGFLEDFQSHYLGVGGDAQDQSRSPDAEGLVIDDAVRSPGDQNLHNTSKDSDMSPGLRIDTDSYGTDEPMAVAYRPPEGQSPEVS